MKLYNSLLGVKRGLFTCIGEFCKIPYDTHIYALLKCECGHVLTRRKLSFQNSLCSKCPSCSYPKPGQRFGRLTFLSMATFSSDRGRMAFLKCDCGQQATVSIGNLNAGFTKSCGCWFKDHLYSTHLSDHHVGKRYHHYKVLKKLPQRKYNKRNISYFLCKCDCGNKFELSGKIIGVVKSCGCKKNPNSKINYEKAEEIRKMYAFGYKKCQLAKMYKLTFFNIRDIVSRGAYASPIRKVRQAKTPLVHPVSSSEPSQHTSSLSVDTQKPYQADLYS